ncbi:type 2 lanthipeptide synthetase LanM family protein [Streptomyces sp. NBC_00207]|uniref:type 2 lanthipeptide synthetase LanM family protein n=1 Tax=Streptomyces sp. NBC_00207 TaxID=2903635 RepID=UPI0032442392
MRAGAPRPGRGDSDPETARARLAQWRSEPQFAHGDGLTRWLTDTGVGEDEFRDVLGVRPTELVEGVDPPPWWEDLRTAYARPAGHDLGRPPYGFLNLVGPLVAETRSRFRERRRALVGDGTPCFDAQSVERSLTGDLLAELSHTVNRTLVTELQLARLRGELDGRTAEQRFECFTERLRDPRAARALLDAYPVLARQLAVRAGHWLDSGLEFLGRLQADVDAVRGTFVPGASPGVVVRLDGRLGDSHRRGRSVRMATFSSGLRVMYKPRPMAVDMHFNALLSWLNRHGATPPFRVLGVLDRGAYGWMECVENTPCESPEAVRRFYLRQGGYLALLYVLEGMDFHAENVIAAGEHPVMVDLEALLHPSVEADASTEAEHTAVDLLSGSVLRVGLLPQRSWATADSPGFDASGIGGSDGQLTPYTVPYHQDAGTDTMRVARKPVPLTGCRNRPSLPGHEVDPGDYVNEVVAGFRQTYGLLLGHRDALSHPSGPLAAFARDEVRVILRETRTYGVLLYESLHPRLLRDALDRDLLFHRLLVETRLRPYLARVAEYEREELWNGDVPVFTARADSRDVVTGTGVRLEGFLAESGLDRAGRRLGKLGTDDLERQVWFIRASMATAERRRDGVPRAPRPVPAAGPDEPARTAGAERLMAAARSAGERLAGMALRGDGDAAWWGFSPAGPGQWSITVPGQDLYDGTAGIALFLGYLGGVTGERNHTDLARAATRTMLRQVERDRTRPYGIGGFTGWGGTVYALTHLGVLWSDPKLLGLAEELAGLIAPSIELDDQHDVIAGAAGCIAALACLHRVRPSATALSAATRCGDHLLTRARPSGSGPAWLNPALGAQPLTGFSHGSAGIAWALLELAALTGRERFRTAALDALAYERDLYDADQGNWPDLRTRPDRNGTGAMTAWCHGASGIGLGRLAMLRHAPDPAIRSEARTAVATTLSRGFGQNHSLCHGDLGNVELLLSAADVLGEPSLRARAAVVAARVLDEIEREGWICGIPRAVESPGLMTGVAGIGYGFLRLANPALVPPVLLLAAPPRYG